MYSYEKLLQKLIQKSVSENTLKFQNISNSLSAQLCVKTVCYTDVLKLAARGLLTITPYKNWITSREYAITLLPQAFLYFEEKRRNLIRFVIPVVISLISLIASVSALIIGAC